MLLSKARKQKMKEQGHIFKRVIRKGFPAKTVIWEWVRKDYIPIEFKDRTTN